MNLDCAHNGKIPGRHLFGMEVSPTLILCLIPTVLATEVQLLIGGAQVMAANAAAVQACHIGYTIYSITIYTAIQACILGDIYRMVCHIG